MLRIELDSGEDGRRATVKAKGSVERTIAVIHALRGVFLDDL